MRRWPAVFAMAIAMPALAADPLTFKGIALGTPRAEVLAALPVVSCQGDRCAWAPPESCHRPLPPDDFCYKAFSYGGVMPDFGAVTFRDGQLVQVVIGFRSERFAELAAAMLERFGSAKQDETGQVQNRMGATFENRRLGWVSGRAALSIVQRTGSVDQGSVSLVDLDYAAGLPDERARAAKAGAKDL